MTHKTPGIPLNPSINRPTSTPSTSNRPPKPEKHASPPTDRHHNSFQRLKTHTLDRIVCFRTSARNATQSRRLHGMLPRSWCRPRPGLGLICAMMNGHYENETEPRKRREKRRPRKSVLGRERGRSGTEIFACCVCVCVEISQSFRWNDKIVVIYPGRCVFWMLWIGRLSLGVCGWAFRILSAICGFWNLSVIMWFF